MTNSDETHQLIIEVPDRVLEGLFYSAYSAIRYWAQCQDDGSWVERKPDEGQPAPHFRINRGRVLHGLAVAARIAPRHFADAIADRGDTVTADVIVQCAVFGEVKYG